MRNVIENYKIYSAAELLKSKHKDLREKVLLMNRSAFIDNYLFNDEELLEKFIQLNCFFRDDGRLYHKEENEVDLKVFVDGGELSSYCLTVTGGVLRVDLQHEDICNPLAYEDAHIDYGSIETIF
jgi:hypothetical protein